MFRYLVMALRTPQFQPSVIEAHQAFLERLRQSGNLEMSGPFTDKTGGAYLLRAANFEEAKALAFNDPLHITKSSVVTVYEWNATIASPIFRSRGGLDVPSVFAKNCDAIG